MNTRIRLHHLVLLALFCTIVAAEPTAKATTDFGRDSAIVVPGTWIDLVVTVDPAGDPVALDGLTVLPAATGAAEFGTPVFPPTDREGGYARPFEVRVPVRFQPGKKTTLELTVAGKLLAGASFEAAAQAKVYLDPEATGHVDGEVALKEPAVAGKPNALVLKLSLIPPYHVYGVKGKQDGLPLVARLLPTGPERLWTGGGPVTPPDKKYSDAFTVEIPFTPLREGRIESRVVVFWQACTDQICDPNEIRYLPVAFDVAPGDGPVDVPADGGDPGVIAKAPDEAPAAAAGSAGGGGGDFESKDLWALLLASIGAGLFALAMPCTYPLIPITISFFTKQAEQREGKILPLALAYGGGIVAIFAGIGVLVGLATHTGVSGEDVLAFATNPWVNGLFALLFLVFGLSLIGLFEIRLPGFFNDLAAKATGSGGYMSVFAMGTTLVITSFTCTAPFVGSLLVWASQAGDWKVVTACMGVFGLTMAIPFVFLSLSPNAIQKLPRSGVWMKHLKVTLGIVELGLVLKFVSNIDLAIGTYLIGRELFLGLWGLSFLAAGLYLLGVFSLFRERLTRGRVAAAAFLLLITAYLYGGLDGTPRERANLEAFLPIIEARYDRPFVAVVYEDLEEGIRIAKENDAPIFLHFTGFQ